MERRSCNLLVTSRSRRTCAVKDFRVDHAAVAYASRSVFAESKLIFDVSIWIYRQTPARSRIHCAASLRFGQRDRGGFGVGDTHFVSRFEPVQELGRFGILYRNCPDNSVLTLEGHGIE
jgi:hypothetical protein